MLIKLATFSKQYGFWILLAFHFFGVVMMAFYDLELFASLTPLNLLQSALLVFFASEKQEWKKLARFFMAAFLIGYWAEVLGTQTGFPFGSYWYLPNLGPQLIEVPLIIGVNWFLLAYSAALWVKRWIASKVWQAALAAALMVLLDFFIEPLCEVLGFWAWEHQTAPWENYLGWYGVSLVVQIIFQRLNIKEDNSLGRWYFIFVTLFFMMLNILL